MAWNAGIHDVVDRVAHVPVIDDLRAAGLLTEAEHASAVARLRASRDWAGPADVLLLVLGAVLLLAGVVFFFAWNWNAIPKGARLGIVEAGIIVCFAASLRTSDLPQRVLMFAASVLVGVFLAVAGQIYQTGADPWTLFAAWAALIVPWTLAAPFPLTTLLLIAVANVAVWLCLTQQTLLAAHAYVFVVLSLLNTTALVACESTGRGRTPRGSNGNLLGPVDNASGHGGKPLRHIFLLGALAPVTFGVVAVLVEPHRFDAAWLNLLVWAAVGAASVYGYRTLRPDLAALSFTALSICTVTLTFIGKYMLTWKDPVTFLLFTLVCVAVFAGAVYVLRRALPSEAA